MATAAPQQREHPVRGHCELHPAVRDPLSPPAGPHTQSALRQVRPDCSGLHLYIIFEVESTDTFRKLFLNFIMFFFSPGKAMLENKNPWRLLLLRLRHLLVHLIPFKFYILDFLLLGNFCRSH